MAKDALRRKDSSDWVSNGTKDFGKTVFYGKRLGCARLPRAEFNSADPRDGTL